MLGQLCAPWDSSTFDYFYRTRSIICLSPCRAAAETILVVLSSLASEDISSDCKIHTEKYSLLLELYRELPVPLNLTSGFS